MPHKPNKMQELAFEMGEELKAGDESIALLVVTTQDDRVNLSLVGDHKMLIVMLAQAIDEKPDLANIFADAILLNRVSVPCDCPACTAKRKAKDN